MTIPTTQDPIDRFSLRIEELRRDSAVRGPARVARNLFLDLFTRLLRLLASLVEKARNGTLPDLAPAGAAEQSRAWPADLRPRENGWLEHRDREATRGGGTMHGSSEHPEIQEPIAEARQVSSHVATAEPDTMVEQPVRLSLLRCDRVGKLKKRPGWHPRGLGVRTIFVGRDGVDRWCFGVWKLGFGAFFSQKGVWGRVWNCACFVTIK